jgi:hypothetical protein
MGRATLGFAVLLAMASLNCKTEGEQPQAEVAAATLCPPSQCAPLAEAQVALGFRPLEPSFLPDGWQLSARELESIELPLAVRELEARARGVQLSEIPLKSRPNLILEYRFHGSDHVPAIVIREEMTDGPITALRPETPDCAETLTLGGRTALYGLGSGMLTPGPAPGEWLGCAQTSPNDRRVHTLLMAVDNVLVRVHAFPEANLTREDMLKLAASLGPAR